MKINVAADVQTGKNVIGAWGFGTKVYFADNVSLLLGPVFFFDEALQPGGRDAHVQRPARCRHPAGEVGVTSWCSLPAW